MNKAPNKKKPFPWRRYVFLIVVSAVAIRTVWLWPRRRWSLKDSHQTTLIPKSTAGTGSYPKDIRHIVLISIDTLRADHLGCYGYSRKTSPNIDALAAESVLFNHTVAPVPLTLPSHCSMLTGTIPYYHKVHGNVNYRLSDSSITLAEVLHKNDFVTGAIVGAFVLDAQQGLDQGFDIYDDHLEGMAHIFLTKNERKAEEVTELANAWLEKHRNEKFFLFLHYFDPHYPYERHKRFWFTSLPSIALRRDEYDAEIAYTDHYVGKVIDKLKQMGLYDSALIILTSDHGESLHEHGEPTHSFFIYHSTVHVPLIVKLPGRSAAAKVNDVAGLIDIVPTVCGLLGIDSPPNIQGQDLSAYFQAEQPSSRDRYLYCESLTPTIYNAESLVGVVTNQYKYIYTTGPELYDLLEDRRETDSVIKKNPRIAKKLQGHLMQILGKTAPRDSGSKVELDEQSLRRLQSLGYVTGTIRDDFNFDQSRADPKELLDFHNSYVGLMDFLFEEEYGKAKKLARKLMSRRPEFHGIYMTTIADVLAAHPDAKVRDPEEAIAIAEHGAKLTKYQDAYNLNTLATAYAAAGRFNQAVKTAQEALKLAVATDDYELADAVRFRLALYKQQKPYREVDPFK